MKNLKKRLGYALCTLLVAVVLFAVYTIGQNNGYAKGAKKGFNIGFTAGVYYEMETDPAMKQFDRIIYSDAIKHFLKEDSLVRLHNGN